MSTAKHTPARQCVACEGFCLVPATIDEANTALAVARTLREREAACDALSLAAEREMYRLRAAIAKATGAA